MERQTDQKFYYEERKKPKNPQVSFMVKSEIVTRIDKLKMSGEKRSAVLRRIVDIGLPIVEAWTKLERGQARLSPVPEDER